MHDEKYFEELTFEVLELLSKIRENTKFSKAMKNELSKLLIMASLIDMYNQGVHDQQNSANNK